MEGEESGLMVLHCHSKKRTIKIELDIEGQLLCVCWGGVGQAPMVTMAMQVLMGGKESGSYSGEIRGCSSAL